MSINTTDSMYSSHHPKSSIDLSLELERDLDAADHPNEHELPTSPALDPDVLSSLVIQLRTNLAEITQSRDDLVTALAHAHQQEAELRDTLSLAAEKNAELQTEVETLRAKAKDDEESIHLLRQKVEESRRGLMRLQTEQRRLSTNLNLDLSKTGQTSRATKRASAQFMPLTGSGMPAPIPSPRAMAHRRSSSVSDPLSNTDIIVTSDDQPLYSPRLEADPSHPSEASQSRPVSRFGTLLRSYSPPPVDLDAQRNHVAEIDSLKKELQSVMSQLQEYKGELQESLEAREASETCVKALREFIAQHAVGEPGQSMPPLPAFAQEPPKKAVGGWGIKLWRSENVVSPPAVQSSSTNSSSSSSQPSNTGPLSPDSTLSTAILTKKLGGFFSRTSSQSSTGATPHSHQQEPMLNGSDTDSAAETEEPISPAHETSAILSPSHTMQKLPSEFKDISLGESGEYSSEQSLSSPHGIAT
ncbi:hypothetical protein SISSUDRAFT_744431 [Sistotremastrum suecicum HHB10207 ss-3]|uniref:Uncharacterized protein n=1 Tax=Sistotremastrum suecicum HHB10207 ss-3 TaxID=1314776 RepID=A0A166HXD2_9AGAM|nr:hypothetical protein SISSUDRAFT_744431 [Sistotremastrum suecicum HHB10207 ss-3]